MPVISRVHLVRLGIFALVAFCAACAQDGAAFREEPIRVAGPWNPPASTRDIARTQWVDVVDPPRISPLGSCRSTNPFACSCSHPACTPALAGTAELDRYLRGRFTYLRSGGLYCCRQNSASGSRSLSVHAIGRAIDLMVPMDAGDADNTLGDAVANFLVENAAYIGVQRVVWDRAFWNGERGFGSLSSASLPHTDHIHVELSLDGAARRTRFFTDGAPPEVCPVVCYGTAVVHADCSTTDCAASGLMCLDGPARCGTPEPPEPPAAVANAGAVLPTVVLQGGLTRLSFVTPDRLFDTRTPETSTRLVRSDASASGPLTASRTATFRDWRGLPADATGVWLNVALVPSAATFATVYPTGAAHPGTSSVNAIVGRVRANAVPAFFGTGRSLTFEAIADTDVITDLYGSFGPSGLGLRTAGPYRVLDTRASGMALAAGVPYALDVRAPADAVGVVATIAVIGGSEPGFVTAFACGEAPPATTHINFAAGRVSSNIVVTGLTDGQLCLQALRGVHVVVDVTGYLVPEGELSYQALVGRRLLDTRNASSLYQGRLGERQEIRIPIQSLPGMPTDVFAVTANITAVTPERPGFITAFPCGTPVPPTSSLNFDDEGAVGGVVVSAIGEGALCIFAQSRTHLIVDIAGVWVPTPMAPPPMPGPGPDDSPDDPDDPMLSEPPMDDAGAVEPEPVDAGTRSTPRVETGCGCRTGARDSMPIPLALGLVFAASVAWRRRRRGFSEWRS